MEEAAKLIIAQLVKLVGRDKVKQYADESAEVSPQGVPNCGPGKIWNPILQRCVDDIG